MKKQLITPILFLIAVLFAYPIETGTPATAFEGKTFDGKLVRLDDFQGKVVMVDFWASWCGPCQKAMPYLIELYKEYKDKGFVIIGINIDKKSAAAQKFLEKLDTKVDFPMIWDKNSEIPPKYELQTMPSTFLIDRKGIIRFTHTDFTDNHKTEYKEEIEKLLSESE